MPVYGFAIGDHDMITGFRLVGVAGAEVSTVAEARIALSKVLSNPDAALIIVSEEFSNEMRDEIEKLRQNRITPLIVEIPGSKGSNRKTRMTDLIRRSLGIKF